MFLYFFLYFVDSYENSDYSRFMKVKLILEEIARKKGQNIPCIWRRPMRVRKGITNLVEKISECVIRAGINFERLKAVQETRASVGESTDHSLPWGEWSKFPFVITHKGQEYIRIYPASLDIHSKVKYLIDGREASREEVEPLCLASEFPKEEKQNLCFTLNVENVVRIGNVIDPTKVKIQY